MIDLAGYRAIVEALRVPAYGAYVAGNAVSLIGNWVQRTAVGWYAWELTGSATWVGAAALADLAPSLIVGPLGGVLADRHERRLIMLTTQSLLCLTVVLMWLMAATGHMGLLTLLALVFLHGLLVGVNQPARLALIPGLVPRHLLTTAVTVNSITFNTARFIGPAVAGITIATFGLAAAFAINALSYVAFIAALWWLRPLETQAKGERQSVASAFREGLTYASRHPVIGPMFLLFIAGSLTLRAVGELLPALSGRMLDGDIGTLAWLSSAMGLGAVVGGFWLAGQGAKSQLRMALLGHSAAAVTSAFFLLSPNLWVATPFVALFGWSLIVAGISAQTLIQLSTAPGLRGRMMSLFGLVFRSAPALGALGLGALGDLIGLRLAIWLGIVGLLAAWVPLWRRRQAMQTALDVASRG